jgi:hypothetical protein
MNTGLKIQNKGRGASVEYSGQLLNVTCVEGKNKIDQSIRDNRFNENPSEMNISYGKWKFKNDLRRN